MRKELRFENEEKDDGRQFCSICILGKQNSDYGHAEILDNACDGREFDSFTFVEEKEGAEEEGDENDSVEFDDDEIGVFGQADGLLEEEQDVVDQSIDNGHLLKEADVTGEEDASPHG